MNVFTCITETITQALTPSTRQTAIAVLLFIADSQEFLLIISRICVIIKSKFASTENHDNQKMVIRKLQEAATPHIFKISTYLTHRTII
jgi:hypothetical protein